MGREATLPAAQAISERLYQDSCIAEPLRSNAGGFIVRPSYSGVVLATQREVAEQERLVNELVDEWETTSVEVKEVLGLGTDREKAEFCKDILALANTFVSGRRFMVIGFNDDTRRFTTSVDQKVDDHGMESVLSSYCGPVPEIKYSEVALANGNAGLIEVKSDRAKLPYTLTRAIGKLKENSVYVRHYTLVVAIEGEDLLRLIEEVRRARVEI